MAPYMFSLVAIDVYQRKKIIFIDNVGSHNETDESLAALTELGAEIRYLPANTTDKTQPCDSFVISKIKDAWTRGWERKKMEMIANDEWQGDGGEGTSGALRNPGKNFFLQLAADSVRSVNAQRTTEGLTYARLAMIRCGLALDVTGQWNVGQLSRELHGIIQEYPDEFAGQGNNMIDPDVAELGRIEQGTS